NWICSAVKSIIEGNKHWATFVGNLLNHNKIDLSDLIEGKLPETEREKVAKLYELLLGINSAKSYTQLSDSLYEAESTGIIHQMIVVHAGWRQTFYGLSDVETND